MDDLHVSTDKTLGENGSPEFTAKGVEESRVALFFALVRHLSQERLKELMDLVREQSNEENVDAIADLFLLTFQTRNCRGGKGEKDLFYKMIIELSMFFPETVSSLMSLVPHYGSYKDWFKIVSLVTADNVDESVRTSMTPVVQTIMDLATKQLLSDKERLDNKPSSDALTRRSNISLLGKWAPREGKQFKKQARTLANKLFPNSKAPKKEYRKLVSLLNTELSTVEVAMSANQFDSIDPNAIPSKCLMKHRKAFLNEKINEPPQTQYEDENGNRHPTITSRVQCRKRLRKAMLQSGGKKLKGRQLFPHEIVEKMLMNPSKVSTLEKDLFQCQWDDIRQNTLDAMKEMAEKRNTLENGLNQESDHKSIDLGHLVPLVDVSGSMNGLPMNVAIALGILVSEISNPAFANRCLTFTSDPAWFEFNSTMSIFDKVEKLGGAPWGYNTDFEKATERILEVATNAKLSPEEIPDLIVFSDMQFDSAKSTKTSWETHHERIVRRFKEQGMKVCGNEWPAPHIIYWNLRSNTTGFPAQGDTPNVTMLSGYSPSLMKLLLDGEAVEEEEDLVVMDKNGNEVVIAPEKRMTKNPFTTLRKALDSEEYNMVRRVLSQSNEGLLRLYNPKEEMINDPITEEKKGEKGDENWEVI